MRNTSIIASLVCSAVLLSACAPPGPNPTNNDPVAPEILGDRLETTARKALSDIQSRSIRENLEYCGSILRRPDGSFYATKAMPGGSDWCEIQDPRDDLSYQIGDQTVADYHTHSSYDYESDSEVPSPGDMESNGAEGIPGYVSTPGGRFWIVEASGQLARQLCGVGCLPMDPDFVPETGVYTVKSSYTFRQLLNRGE